MSNPLFADDMWEIVESFIVETREILDDLDQQLLLLEENAHDKALVDEIFRAVHTIKGTSGFLSLEQLSVLAHHFEDVLNRLRRGELDFYPAMMDVMLAAFDQMKVLLQQVADQQIVPLDLDGILGQLQAISEGTFEAGTPPPAIETEAAQEEAADEAPAAAEPAEATDEEPDTDEAEPQAADEAAPAEAAPANNAPDEAPTPEPVKAASPEPAAPAQADGQRRRASETIRVEVDRLDALMNLVGELVLGRNRLLQLTADLETTADHDELHRDLADASTQVDFITTELQTAIMRTRMVQIGRVFGKFTRVVRDLAREFDKQIVLETDGEETELDKSIVEEISDPLVHLIRNSADHGIETPEARMAAGKPAEGTVRLSAAHEGNHVVIRIADDGAGMDPEKLKAKAIENGILTPKEAQDMTDAEAYALIFRAGFSTAQRVSKVSGRGVGMDVVKTNITRLNGTVSIESKLGRGTTFTLKLPLTLAILQSLLVRVAGETFAVPLHAVIEVVGLQPGDVSTINGREVIRIREQVLPLLRVGDVLDVDQPERPERAYAVVVGIAHHRLGLVVDDLVGQKEIVIKPLGNYLKKIPGIAGSTILGDGRVIMIADVGEMLRLERERMRAGAVEG